MIALGTKEIDPLFIGGKKIKKVYFGTNLVYPSFPKFTTIECNGWGGTYDGSSYIQKGTYRVILVGGGGSTGATWKSGRHGGSSYYWSFGPGGGACVYCIINIPNNGILGYKVGNKDTQSVLRVNCDGKYDMTIIANQGEKVSKRRVGLGGTITTYGNTYLIKSAAIWSTGNNGNRSGEHIYCAYSISGALSVCKGGGFGEYPYIDLQWGRGAALVACGARELYHGEKWQPGYFKIERIG